MNKIRTHIIYNPQSQDHITSIIQNGLNNSFCYFLPETTVQTLDPTSLIQYILDEIKSNNTAKILVQSQNYWFSLTFIDQEEKTFIDLIPLKSIKMKKCNDNKLATDIGFYTRQLLILCKEFCIFSLITEPQLDY